MQIFCSTHSVILNVIAISTHAHSTASTSPSDGKVIIVHACAFQSTLLGCQVISMSHKLFLLYLQCLDFFQIDIMCTASYLSNHLSKNIMNNASVHIRVHISLWINDFKIFSRYQEECLLGHMVTLFLIFWGASILISIVISLYYMHGVLR